MLDRPKKIKCPNCGSTRIEALVHHETTVYSDHLVRGVLNGKLVLKERPLKRWDSGDDYESELDEELKCRACKRDFDIEEAGIKSQAAFTYEPKSS